jgi:hypothetical protein
MAEERGVLVRLAESAVGRGLVAGWEKLSPLSAGAVVTSLLVVGAAAALKRSLGRGASRTLGLLGTAVAVPLVLWLLSGDDESRAEREAGRAHGRDDNVSAEGGDDG